VIKPDNFIGRIYNVACVTSNTTNFTCEQFQRDTKKLEDKVKEIDASYNSKLIQKDGKKFDNLIVFLYSDEATVMAEALDLEKKARENLDKTVSNIFHDT
jgi:hypothetical protein